MTQLSVLTLVKNRGSHLNRLIEALDRSSCAPLELIVVDMSDTPATPLASTTFPTRILRFATRGLPLAAARNMAAREARGDRLLFLDVDCMPKRDLAERMENELDAADALVCAEVRYLRAGAVKDGWTEPSLDASSDTHPVRDFPCKGRREEHNAGLFWSLVFGIRGGSFQKAEGFDERFVGYGAEDTDFGFRCRQSGLPLIFIGGTGAYHQHHPVYAPPLQHFQDILANAKRFRERWGFWPMEGWLKEFADLGLIEFDEQRLAHLRDPNAREVAAALKETVAF